MVVLETIWNGIKAIISKIFELLWFVLSKALELLWKLLISYWYIFLAVTAIAILIWVIVGLIEDRRLEKYAYLHTDSSGPIECKKSLEEAAEIVCGRFDRVDYLYCSCGNVCINVCSQSGQTVWQSTIRFNEDYDGNITGEYSIDSDNEQSRIPEHVAKEILKEIQAS